MSSETSSAHLAVELSARLDGEVEPATAELLDAHLEQCPECRRHEDELIAVRRALRAQPAEAVPDLSGPIMERVAVERAAAHVRSRKRGRVRIAALAAAAAAVALAGVSLPWGERPVDSAAASDIERHLRLAARTLGSYRAEYRITERGWHPDVPIRRFRASIAYRAPESLRLRITDTTAYPAGATWPHNDVALVANGRSWWIREPSTCPTQSLPGCAPASLVERRSVVRRQPFDGSTALPTDIIVPLETVASSGGFAVLGRDRVLGRETHVVALPYVRALPLVAALQQGGSWRSFSPRDRVEIWLDRATWFPLRFRVLDGPTDDRVLLEVRATSFSERALARDSFAVPRASLARSGGFDQGNLGAAATAIAPAETAGLDPYRRGTTDQGQTVLTYAQGMTWLKVVAEPMASGAPSYPATAEQVRLDGGDFAYYEPATEWSKRRVSLFGRRVRVHLESNLARATLLDVAATVGVRGMALEEASGAGGFHVERLEEGDLRSFSFAATPSYLPDGYRFSSALLSAGGMRTLTVYYRRPETEYGFGIRVTRSPHVKSLPPTNETDVRSLRVAGDTYRWSPQRGELEWIEGDVYVAVAASSYERATVLRIATSLR